MYTLLTHNNFGMQSGEFISAIGCQYTILDKKFFIKQKMGVLKFESFLLNKQRPITTHAENSCVIDYFWDQVKGKRGFKTYTYEKLKNEIYKYVNGTMISTEELINWTKDCHSNVSIHAFDSRYRKFIAHNNNCSNVTLVYVVKDNHCFPITDEKLKLLASKANQGDCKNLLKHMTDMKWIVYTKHMILNGQTRVIQA